jgi:hypothetical protein
MRGIGIIWMQAEPRMFRMCAHGLQLRMLVLSPASKEGEFLDFQSLRRQQSDLLLPQGSHRQLFNNHRGRAPATPQFRKRNFFIFDLLSK